jgi:hypothetical protein
MASTSERKIRSIFEHFRNVGSFVILISGACCCKLLLTLLLGHLFTKLFEITVMLLTVQHHHAQIVYGAGGGVLVALQRNEVNT